MIFCPYNILIPQYQNKGLRGTKKAFFGFHDLKIVWRVGANLPLTNDTKVWQSCVLWWTSWSGGRGGDRYFWHQNVSWWPEKGTGNEDDSHMQGTYLDWVKHKLLSEMICWHYFWWFISFPGLKMIVFYLFVTLCAGTSGILAGKSFITANFTCTSFTTSEIKLKT